MKTPSVLCPECLEPVVVGDSACPNCGTPVGNKTRRILNKAARQSAGAAAVAAREAVGTREQWERVRDGLGLITNGVLVLILGTIVAGVLALAAPLMALIAAPAIIVAALMIIYGQLRTLSVPAESGLRGLISTAVALSLLAIAGDITLRAMISNGTSQPDPLVMRAPQIAALVGNILFLLFLRGLGNYLGSYELSSGVVSWIWFAIGFAVADTVVYRVLADGILPEATPIEVVVVVLAMLALCGVMLMVWNIILLAQGRDAIDDWLARARRFAMVNPSEASVLCKACGEPVMSGQTNCQNCGEKLTDETRKILASEAKRQIDQAKPRAGAVGRGLTTMMREIRVEEGSYAMLTVALLMMLASAAVALAGWSGVLVPLPLVTWIAGLYGGLAGVYLGLHFWAQQSPVPAFTLGLLLYLGLELTGFVVSGPPPVYSIVVSVAVVVSLVLGLTSAMKLNSRN